MTGSPCENPNCPSCGKPHPNCRCVAMADGGEAIDPNNVVMDSAPQGQEVPANEVTVDPEIPEDEVKLDSDKYSTTGQKVAAGLEGASQGTIGFLAPLLETKLGISSPEDVAGRAEANPLIHSAAEAGALGASMYYGIGEAKAIATAAEHLLPEAIPILGKLGANAIKAGAQMGLFQASDEIGKALLGQAGGDVQAAASSAMANIKNAALLGIGITGVLGVPAAAAAKALKNTKISGALNDFMAGVGAAASKAKNPGELIAVPEGANAGHFDKGVKFFNEGIGNLAAKAPRAITDTAAGWIAGASEHSKIFGAMTSAAVDRYLGPIIEKFTKKPLTAAAQKYIVPSVLKALSSGSTEGVGQAIDYATNVSRGAQHITNYIDGLFRPAEQQAYDYVVSDSERDKLKDHIENGGTDSKLEQQLQNDKMTPVSGYADGGLVTPPPPTDPAQKNHLAEIFPEQSMMLHAAQARITGYLNAIRPIPQPKLPFDEENLNTQQKRSYDKAIDIAIKPLSVLNKLKKGTLSPEDMKHANTLYPEMMDHLRKKMTERITKAQLHKEKPTYSMRQGMSLFLGTALDGSLTPQAIQAAQNVFIQRQAPQQQQGAPKQNKSKGSLTKLSDSYQTGDQARAARGQKS